MHKILFSLALFALCASPANSPALADTPVDTNPGNGQQAAEPQTKAGQPDNTKPDNQQSGNAQAADTHVDVQQPGMQPDMQADRQQNTASSGSDSGAKATAGDPQNQPPAEALHTLPPLRELVTSPFGNRRMPGWLSRRGLVMRDHAGVDIRARMGWPVTAFKPGKVVRAGDNGAMGISVDIKQDDGMTARYGHMSKTLAKSGQRVEAGETVGLVGCTGRTTGAHLHFGLHDAAGKAVDPLPYLHSADEVLRPDPASIPEVLEAQSCGPVQRGPNGRPVRLGEMLKKMDSYSPPPLPAWNERP